MVMEPEVFRYLTDEEGCVFERQPLERLALEGKLGIYKHKGFWQCMDTQRDKIWLEEHWERETPPGGYGKRDAGFLQQQESFCHRAYGV